MKITFTPPSDTDVHTYCLYCGNENVQSIMTSERLSYHCSHCKQDNTRALIIDPKVTWWLDETQEYWHETAGIFVVNSKDEFLFFERTRHPFGLTIPAGHRDVGEQPKETARRELFEETNVKDTHLTHVATTDIYGDECRRGSDIHRWHIFTTHVPSTLLVKVDVREGVRPMWLDLNQALSRELTHATRQVITQYHSEIIRTT